MTPEVEEALRWFELTHELQLATGGARWTRIALPAAGGLEDQDARLMQLLEVTRGAMNSVLRIERRAGRSDAEMQRFKRKYFGHP